jgi:hypothetical protein
MQSREAIKKRMAELQNEVEAKTAQFGAGRIADKSYYSKFVDKADAEMKDLKSQLKAWDSVARYAGAADSTLGGVPSAPPTGLEPLRPVSPYDMTPEQVHGLIQAAKHRTPFSVQIGQKRVGEPEALRMSLQTKSAVSESGITSAFSSANFPPYQSIHAIGKAYEPVRVASLFPGVAYNRQALSWLTHTANSSTSGSVAELGTKGDIGEDFSETTVVSTVIAGLASASLQSLWDTEEYGEANLAAMIPYELQRDVINQESLALLQAGYSGGPTGYSFSGLLATSGTLTRAYSTSSGLSPLDTVAAAFNDLRVGAAFCTPDTVITNPSTLLGLRTEKDSTGRYIWNMLEGAGGLTPYGAPPVNSPGEPSPYSITPQGMPAPSGHLWGVPVYVSTQCPDGVLVALSVKDGGGLVFQRMGMLIEYNMWAENLWQTNTAQWRCEERIAFAVQRPAAVNILTNLPF